METRYSEGPVSTPRALNSKLETEVGSCQKAAAQIRSELDQLTKGIQRLRERIKPVLQARPTGGAGGDNEVRPTTCDFAMSLSESARSIADLSELVTDMISAIDL